MTATIGRLFPAETNHTKKRLLLGNQRPIITALYNWTAQTQPKAQRETNDGRHHDNVKEQ